MKNQRIASSNNMAEKSNMPYVICHMMCSVDGKIFSQNWAGSKAGRISAGLYEKIHMKFHSQAWMCGRVTMERDFADGTYSHKGTKLKDKQDFIADPKAKSFAVAIDPRGKLAWKENNIDGDHLIEILTEQLSQSYVEYLQSLNISYLFAGVNEIDLGVTLKKLSDYFPIETVMLEGGGNLNGQMLKASLINELSLLVLPLADGSQSTTVFEMGAVREMKLKTVKKLSNGVLWLKYKVN